MATRESPAFGTQAATARTEPAREVDLTIVIPAFNEEERLPASLGAVSAYLAARPSAPRVEVLVVDDGSSDATASRAEDAGRRHGLDLRVLRLPKNRGKGFAVRAGCLEAAGRRLDRVGGRRERSGRCDVADRTGGVEPDVATCAVRDHQAVADVRDAERLESCD